MENEIWKDIKGYEGKYKVSNFGRVKSLKRIIPDRLGRNNFVQERILKAGLESSGYYMVVLHINNMPKNRKVHRLVSSAFIPNPQNKPQVNHINGIRTDNRVDNLEWVTNQENSIHSYEILGRKPSMGAIKSVLQFSKSGEFVAKYKSIKEAYDALNVPCRSSTISSCCKGRAKTAHGFVWKYKD